ncbi:hypothetical protein LT330_010710 [Penicillium expansum]|nr:hypothetical protein LT330_010710 [Penicillium expansum]
MGLMLGAKLSKSNGIENHIIETVSFDVFHNLKPIGRKPNPHGLVWLEFDVNEGGKGNTRANESALSLWQKHQSLNQQKW